MRSSRMGALPRRIALPLTVAAMGLLAAPAFAAAADRYVATTGDDQANDCLTQAVPCQTIDHAVTVAVAGDTVRVAAGTYTESVDVGKSLSFVGPFDGWTPGDPPPGAPAILLSAVSGNAALSVDADNVSVSGFTFGDATGPVANRGIEVQSGSDGFTLGSSTFTHLETGLVLDGTDTASVITNAFDENLRAIAGFSDASSLIYLNAFTGNPTGIELDGSTNASIQLNDSTDDSTFARLRVTNSTSITDSRITNAAGEGIVVSGDSNLTLMYNALSGDSDGIRFVSTGDPEADDAVVEFNDLAGLDGNGLTLDPGSIDADSFTLDGNRFFNTGGFGLYAASSLGTVTAENNWWGCNAGPNIGNCVEVFADAGTTVDADPWTVMSLSADPTSLPINSPFTSDVTADFNTNSDGDPVPTQGIADDVPVGFTASLGDIDSVGCTCSGQVIATLTPGNTPGTSHVTASLDGQSVSTDVEFTSLLSVSPTSAAFGRQAVSTSSPTQTFTITNNQTFDLPVDSVELIGDDPADFKRFANACVGTTLTTGASCQFSVVFRPAGTGPKNAFVRIQSSGETIDLPLSGTGITATPIVFAPPSWDFGTQQVNASSPTQSVALHNTSNAPVTISAVALAGANPGDFVRFAGACLNVTVPSGGSCTVSALFRPTSAGAKSADLKVTTTEGAVQTVVLSGTGTTTPPLTLDPTSWDFGTVNVGQQSATKAFTITNSSGSNQTISSVSLAGTNTADFVRYAGGCTNKVLTPGDSCTVSALFKPLTTGAKTAQLKVTFSGGSPMTIGLTGNATTRT